MKLITEMTEDIQLLAELNEKTGEKDYYIEY